MGTYQQFVHANDLLLVKAHRRVAPQTLARSQEFRVMPLADEDRDVADEIKKRRWEYSQEDCDNNGEQNSDACER